MSAVKVRCDASRKAVFMCSTFIGLGTPLNSSDAKSDVTLSVVPGWPSG